MGLTETTKAIKNNQGKKGRNSKDIYFSGYDMLGGMVASLIITKVLDNVPFVEEKKDKKRNSDGLPH